MVHVLRKNYKRSTCRGNNVSPLSEEDLVLYNKFVNLLLSPNYRRNKQLIYRGDKNIREKYNTGTEDLTKLSKLIFMVGDKAAYFRENQLKYNIKDESIYSFLFDKFADKVCNPSKFHNSQTLCVVNNFLDSNPQFRIFFGNKDNKDLFEGKIEESNDKESIIDYYFSLLHLIGKSANGASYFLSSSKSFKIAEKFRNDEGIILIGWVPSKEKNKFIISYEDTEKLNKKIKELGLPIYERSPYPEQREICLKCGMFPHFIIGYVYKNDFIINPHLLDFMRSMNDDAEFKNMLRRGLRIDQSNFDDLISKTKFHFVSIFCDGEYVICNRDERKSEINKFGI